MVWVVGPLAVIVVSTAPRSDTMPSSVKRGTAHKARVWVCLQPVALVSEIGEQVGREGQIIAWTTIGMVVEMPALTFLAERIAKKPLAVGLRKWEWFIEAIAKANIGEV